MKIHQQRNEVIINQDAALQRKSLATSVSRNCPPTGICDWILGTAGFSTHLELFFKGEFSLRA